MAKKLGKLLLCTALIGSAVAGGMALYNKYKASSDDFDDDLDNFDFDDFDDDDFDDEDDSVKEDSVNASSQNRGYVSIPRDSEADSTISDDIKVNVTIAEDDNVDDDTMSQENI